MFKSIVVMTVAVAVIRIVADGLQVCLERETAYLAAVRES
jgi:hypothetical protein